MRSLNDIGVESVVNSNLKSLRLDSFTIHERIEECVKLCVYESKKLYRLGGISLLQLSEDMV